MSSPHRSQRQQPRFLFSLFCLLCLLQFILIPVSSITALLRQNDEECFFDTSSIGDEIHGTFSVTHGTEPIEVKIFNPEDKIVLHLPSTMEDAYTFITLVDGFYTVCFASKSAELMTVEFSLHVGDDVSVKNVMKEDHLTPISDAMNVLRRGVNELNEQTKYHRNRLIRHKTTTESTSSRISFWSIIEGIVLVCIAAVQTWLIRSMFEKKRSV